MDAHQIVSTGYMTPEEFKRTRLALGLTQQALADQLKRKRLAIARYEGGTRTIPGVVGVALQSSDNHRIHSSGLWLQAIPRTHPTNRTLVPKSMLGRGETFALRVKGTSMRDGNILGDVVVVQKQDVAPTDVIALLGEATINTITVQQARSSCIRPTSHDTHLVHETDTFHIEALSSA